MREVKHGAKYQGTVYDQTVWFEVGNGQELCLFDKDAVVSESDVGRRVSLLLEVLPTDGVRFREDEPHIARPDDPISEWAYDFAGEVTRIIENPEWLKSDSDTVVILDINVGTILVSSSTGIKQLVKTKLHLGDELFVPGSRTDILAVYDD